MNENKLTDQELILNGFFRCLVFSLISGISISLLLCLFIFTFNLIMI